MRRRLSLFCLLGVFCIVLFISQIIIRLHPAAEESDVVFPESELVNLEDATQSYRKGYGMISITCTGLPASGSVYVYVNSVAKLRIRGKDPVNLKIKAGDVIYIKGFGYDGQVTAVISSVVGQIDQSILNKTVTIGSLAKHLVTIAKLPDL